MSYGFEITSDDISNVMRRIGQPCDDDKADELLNEIDIDAVERAAMYSDDMDEQTDYAYQEIEKQLADLGYRRSQTAQPE